MSKTEVFCSNCNTWVPSVFAFVSIEAFNTSTIKDVGQVCPHCGSTIAVDSKTNMRFIE